MESYGAMPTEIPILTPHQMKSMLETGVLLIDLRQHDAFASGHIPRSVNVAFSRKSLAERIATAIPPDRSIILFSDEATVAKAAGDALYGIDRNPLPGIVTTGIDMWRTDGLPLAALPQISAAALRQRLHAPHDDLVLIDVREPFEWEWGYIKESLLIPLGEIWQRSGSLDPRKEIILICAEGLRSSTAASILLHHCFPRIGNVPGGMGNWLNADYPTVRLSQSPQH
ncbi:MAG TPA: rhodanese-like domain-containing protein [Patescibacteria group bacterium]|nr:rhodanese-like domain-containing protein [Patescibacteria group bacterium]